MFRSISTSPNQKRSSLLFKISCQKAQFFFSVFEKKIRERQNILKIQMPYLFTYFFKSRNPSRVGLSLQGVWILTNVVGSVQNCFS